ETIREFGLEQLAASGEEEAVRDALARWALAFAGDPTANTTNPGYERWVNRAERDLPTLRVAFAWLIDSDQVEGAIQLAKSLRSLWWTRGRAAEGRLWLERALAAVPGEPAAVLSTALSWSGLLAAVAGDEGIAAERVQQGLAMAEELGDPVLRSNAHR